MGTFLLICFIYKSFKRVVNCKYLLIHSFQSYQKSRLLWECFFVWLWTNAYWLLFIPFTYMMLTLTVCIAAHCEHSVCFVCRWDRGYWRPVTDPVWRPWSPPSSLSPLTMLLPRSDITSHCTWFCSGTPCVSIAFWYTGKWSLYIKWFHTFIILIFQSIEENGSFTMTGNGYNR